MKLLFVEAPMVSQCDSIADSHNQRESETITTMSGSYSESSGTQQFLKDAMESSDSEYKNIISDVTCDCVAVVDGLTSVSCDDKFEEDGKAIGESQDCFVLPFTNESVLTKFDFTKNILFNHR